MKYFLVVAICIEGLCQNFVTTEPQFDSYQAIMGSASRFTDRLLTKD